MVFYYVEAVVSAILHKFHAVFYQVLSIFSSGIVRLIIQKSLVLQ